MRQRRDNAFTLAEVLVVLMIVGILASLLFPVIAQARRAAYRPDEAARLRNIYVAVVLYEEDHDGGSPTVLPALHPLYLDRSRLAHPLDARWQTPRPDWPAAPWAFDYLVDERRPGPLQRSRSATMVSYDYLPTRSTTFAPGRAYEDYRKDPRVGFIVGLGLMTCSTRTGGLGCDYWEDVPGNPAGNLIGTFLTARTDGSITTRTRPDLECPQGREFSELFLMRPSGCYFTSLK